MIDLMRKCMQKGLEFEENEKMYIHLLGSLNEDDHLLRYPKQFDYGMALDFAGISSLIKKFDGVLLSSEGEKNLHSICGISTSFTDDDYL